MLESQAAATSLSSFAGAPASGEWTLFVADMDSGGTNLLLGRELELTGYNAFVGIPNHTSYVLMPLVITNRIADSNQWSGPLTFGSGAGVPGGARVNPGTGVFRWTLTIEYSTAPTMRNWLWPRTATLPLADAPAFGGPNTYEAGSTPTPRACAPQGVTVAR